MKIQSIEARVRRALMRDGLTPNHARKAAVIAAREVHADRMRLAALVADSGIGLRGIERLLGISKSHLQRLLSHRSRTDGTRTRNTMQAPQTEGTPCPQSCESEPGSS